MKKARHTHDVIIVTDTQQQQLTKSNTEKYLIIIRVLLGFNSVNRIILFTVFVL